VFLPGISDSPIRTVLAAPFVLFVPGYALIAALFPRISVEPDRLSSSDTGSAFRSRGLTLIERMTLSIGSSIALVILVGLLIEASPWKIRLGSVFLAISLLTVGAVVFATIRRLKRPSEERIDASFASIAARAADAVRPETNIDGLLNAALMIAIVLAAATVGYGVTGTQDRGSFTELYILSEQQDGDVVAGGYPTEFVQGESREIIVGVNNNEHSRIRYTLLIELQRLSDDDSAQIIQRTTLGELSTSLEHGEAWRSRQNVTPPVSSNGMRLAFLLYRGSPPPNPTLENAYRETHLWINVTARK
jgi:uncharacterized membrane protein